MSKEKLVPKLRFKEFKKDKEWENKLLGEIVSFYSGLTYSPNDIVDEKDTLVLRSSNVKNGEIVQADDVYVDSKIVNSDNVQVGDIIVVVRNGSRHLIGKNAQIKQSMEKTVIGAFMTGIRSDIPKFIKALLDTNRFQVEIYKDLGATINQITTGNFKKMSFKFPKEEESNKIGSYFENIDEMIQLQQSKVNKVKDIKSAYLSEMFPKEGEKYPKKRFEGFNHAWVSTTFGEFLKTEPFKKYLAKEDRDGIYPVIQQGDNPIDGYANGTPYKNYDSVILFGDHTLSLYKPERYFLIASDGIKILNNNSINRNYLYYLLERYMPESEGYKRHYSILKNKVAYMTNNKKEQRKIGEFLKNLDNQISTEEEKLAKLEKLKQAYLNDMFV